MYLPEKIHNWPILPSVEFSKYCFIYVAQLGTGFIQANYFPFFSYTVVLTYRKGLRVAKLSKRLITEAQSRPLVYLRTSSTKKVPTSVLLFIDAKITAKDFSGDINYYWHCQGGYNFHSIVFVFHNYFRYLLMF